jgi:hypothetical protein
VPEAEWGIQLRLVFQFLLKLVTGTNLLALKTILPALGTADWLKLFGGVSVALQRELNDAMADIASRHWDSNLRDAARGIREKFQPEAKVDDRRTRHISSSKTLGVLAPLAPDRFVEGWRSVVKEGGRRVPGLDQVVFLKNVSDLALLPSEDSEFGATSRFRGLRRATCDGTRSMVFK